MRKYHHIGIPTQIRQPGETYLERYRIFCTDHERNPYGILWMRFEPECQIKFRTLLEQGGRMARKKNLTHDHSF